MSTEIENLRAHRRIRLKVASGMPEHWTISTSRILLACRTSFTDRQEKSGLGLACPCAEVSALQQEHELSHPSMSGKVRSARFRRMQRRSSSCGRALQLGHLPERRTLFIAGARTPDLSAISLSCFA